MPRYIGFLPDRDPQTFDNLEDMEGSHKDSILYSTSQRRWLGYVELTYSKIRSWAFITEAEVPKEYLAYVLLNPKG